MGVALAVVVSLLVARLLLLAGAGLAERSERGLGYSGGGATDDSKHSLSGRGESWSGSCIDASSICASVDILRGGSGRLKYFEGRLAIEEEELNLLFSGKGVSWSLSTGNGLESVVALALLTMLDRLFKIPGRLRVLSSVASTRTEGSQKSECLKVSGAGRILGDPAVICTATPRSSPAAARASVVCGFLMLDLRGTAEGNK